MKRCSSCKNFLDVGMFGKNKSCPDGLAYYCTPCTKIKRLGPDKKYASSDKGVSSRRKAIRKYCRKMRKTSPEYKIKQYIRNRLRGFLQTRGIRKQYKFSEYIGISPLELKKYIESLFAPGMTWKNQGEWHIDHKIPLSKAENVEEIYKLNHYTNLQPLWARDNLIKGNKV